MGLFFPRDGGLAVFEKVILQLFQFLEKRRHQS